MSRLSGVLIVLLTVATTLTAVFAYGRFSSASITTAAVGPPKISLERIRELATMRVYVADVLVGHGAKYKGSWIIKGDALLSINLANAVIGYVDPVKKTLEIRLPQPRVQQPRVDHEKTRKWDIQHESWIPFTGDPDVLRDESMLAAQKLVEEAAGSEEYRALARVQAECAIRALYDVVGWNVKIVWQ